MKSDIMQYFSEYPEMTDEARSYSEGDFYHVGARAEPCPGCGKLTEVRRVVFRDNGEHVCTLVYCPLCAAKTFNRN